MEVVNEAIKSVTSTHSDMTFLYWTKVHERREIKVFSENTKKRRGAHRASSNQSR